MHIVVGWFAKRLILPRFVIKFSCTKKLIWREIKKSLPPIKVRHRSAMLV